jgi:hypothetical protein
LPAAGHSPLRSTSSSPGMSRRAAAPRE